MNADLYAPSYGKIELLPGWPAQSGIMLLPHASSYWTTKDFGTILLQEIRTEHHLLRYFIFYFFQQIKLHVKERNEGLQSMLALKGELQHGMKGHHQMIGEGQFTILNAGKAETETIIPAGKECHLLNTYHSERAYSDLLPLIPSLKKDLKKAVSKPRFFLPYARPARHSVLDAIQEILKEKYKPQLLKVYWELKLRQALFTQLAQIYTEETGRLSTPLEKEMAIKAHSIITSDISKHFSNEELAEMVGWSESSLKRAFRQEFGMGMYEYLRRTRMHKARDLLLQGEQVKNVAPAIGMRPSNFTTEFQKFFGYKSTSLRKVRNTAADF